MFFKIKNNKLKCFINNFFINKNQWLNYSISQKNYEEPTIFKEINSQEIKPYSDRLTFITKNSIKKGWYLFCIRHKGENNRCSGWLKVKNGHFLQGRPMYPVRRRWRVIRINQKKRIILELQNIVGNFYLKELYLIRIPGFDAWRRIFKRLSLIDPSNTINLQNQKRKDNWRIYNKLLLAQIRNNPFITFEYWQKKIENGIILDFKKLNYESKTKLNIHDQIIPRKINSNEWNVFINRDNFLRENSINMLKFFIDQHKDCKLIYGDEDEVDHFGNRINPKFKPAWNRELFWSNLTFSSVWVVKGDLWNDIIDYFNESGKEISFKSLIYRIIYKLETQQSAKRIKHLPFILSSKKISENKKVTANEESKNYKLLQEHLNQIYEENPPKIKKNLEGGFKLQWPLPKNTLVSVIIPTKDKLELLKECIYSIKKYPPGCDIEILIIDNNSEEEETIKFLNNFHSLKSGNINQIVVEFPGEFNFSEMNNYAVKKSNGNVILLLNNDVSFLEKGWGYELSSNALRNDIGCVGCKLLFPDQKIQHGGVILGIGGIAGHAHKYLLADSDGYNGRLNYSQEFSAVTAACMAISRANWEILGGMNAVNLKVNYNDVDLCLKAKKIGLKNIYLPHVKAIHKESKTRGRPEGKAFLQWKREAEFIKKNWFNILYEDPAYSPYLSLDYEDFSISLRKPPNLDLR